VNENIAKKAGKSFERPTVKDQIEKKQEAQSYSMFDGPASEENDNYVNYSNFDSVTKAEEAEAKAQEEPEDSHSSDGLDEILDDIYDLYKF